MITNFTSSGFNWYRRLTIIVFNETDFPEPVVPAISKWGISTRSRIDISPRVPFPMANFNLALDLRYFSELITFFK